MRFRKTWQDSCWWLGELREVPRYLLWRGLRHHCPMYSVSCMLYLLQSMSLFFILHSWIPSRLTSYVYTHIIYMYAYSFNSHYLKLKHSRSCQNYWYKLSLCFTWAICVASLFLETLYNHFCSFWNGFFLVSKTWNIYNLFEFTYLELNTFFAMLECHRSMSLVYYGLNIAL